MILICLFVCLAGYPGGFLKTSSFFTVCEGTSLKAEPKGRA